MRMRCVPGGSLSGEVGGHGARAAGGEAQVVKHANPFPAGVLRLDVRRDRLDPRLVRRIHAGGAEVLDLAVHHQPERAAAISFAEIKLQGMSLGETLEGQEIEVAKVTMRQQMSGNTSWPCSSRAPAGGTAARL